MSVFLRRLLVTRCFRDILTRQSFLNAIVIITILGGSTNAVRRLWLTDTSQLIVFLQVLHLLAMARAADVELAIDDFQMISDKTPYLADLKCVLVVENLGRNEHYPGRQDDITWKIYIGLVVFRLYSNIY